MNPKIKKINTLSTTAWKKVSMETTGYALFRNTGSHDITFSWDKSDSITIQAGRTVELNKVLQGDQAFVKGNAAATAEILIGNKPWGPTITIDDLIDAIETLNGYQIPVKDAGFNWDGVEVNAATYVNTAYAIDLDCVTDMGRLANGFSLFSLTEDLKVYIRMEDDSAYPAESGVLDKVIKLPSGVVLDFPPGNRPVSISHIKIIHASGGTNVCFPYMAVM